VARSHPQSAVSPVASDPVTVRITRRRRSNDSGRLCMRGHPLRCPDPEARDCGVAYDTVRRAAVLLRERGLIITVHGRGTYVA